MAHWIIEDKGFGGQIYKCSNCHECWNDLFHDIYNWTYCPSCHEDLEEDKEEYFKYNDNNEYIQDAMIRASRKAGLTRNQLLDTLFEEGVLAVYNLGMKHMYEYLEDKW